MLPVEFVVEGPPVSYQTRFRARLREWQAIVAGAARSSLPPGAAPVSGRHLKITVTYYHEHPVVRIDTDNLVKPIQDALQGIIYPDDVLITETVVRKRSIQGFRETGLSPLVAASLAHGTEFLHVRVEFAATAGAP